MDRFGTRLRDARLALGLSQSDASRSLLSVGDFALIESGLLEPDPVLAQALADRMHIPLTPDAPITSPQHRAAVSLETALRLGDWPLVESLLAAETVEPAARLFFSAFVSERRGDFAAAMASLSRAITIASSALARTRIMLALCRCARDSGNLQQSVDVGESALMFIQSGGLVDDELETELRATLAGTYCETGDLVRALDLTEPMDGASPQASWGAVTRLWARAMTLQTMGRFEHAHVIAQKALIVLRGLDRPVTLARMQNAAAWISMRIPGFDVGEIGTLLEESAAMFRRFDAPVQLALVLTSQAELAALQGQEAQAHSHIEEALALVAGEDAGERARITAAAAQIYASLGDTDTSMQHLLTARTLLEDSGAKRSAAAAWKLMAETYAALGHTDLQLACLRAAMELLEL